jgi:hypothetical protein
MSDGIEKPDIASWLSTFIDTQRSQYEEQFGDADEGSELARAIDAFKEFAGEVVTTGVLPPALESSLAEFRPGDAPHYKVLDLLRYQVVHHRLEFETAEEAVNRLFGIEDRVRWVTGTTALILGYKPSPSALKYFRTATQLFLAGYTTETTIMCGAVLEAALRTRFPDEVLRSAGMDPVFRRSGDYSVAQRLAFERRQQVLLEEHRDLITKLLSWRNDAVHVQPDIGPDPQLSLLYLAVLLHALLPDGYVT